MRARANKKCANDDSLWWLESELKNKTLKYENMKNKGLKSRFGFKKRQVHFFINCVLAPLDENFVLDTTKICAKERFVS